MASELQRRKVSGVVRAMDANGDGFLEEADFTDLTARWAAIRGSAPGSADHEELGTIMMGWWRTLLSASGDISADRITVDDVLMVVDRLGEMKGAVAATANVMFEAVDENGDGKISAGEYKRLIEAWNGRTADTDDVFPLLDLDGDGHISGSEFRELWTEFWAGDDPGSPGNWMFGRFALPTLQDH